MGRSRTITDSYQLNTEADLGGLNAARDGIEDLADEIAAAGKDAANAGDDFQRGSGALGAFSGAALGVIAALGGMAVLSTVTDAISGTVAAILEADQSFNLLQAQTGLTADEMDVFRVSAENLYLSGLGESLDAVTQAMGKVYNITKLTGPELETMTANALTLEQVFGYDVVESTRAADQAMQAFEISGTQAMDFIGRTAQATGDPMGDLLDTINEYGPVMAQNGYSAELFFAMLEQGSAAGAFNLDKIADGAKEFGIRMSEGGDEARIAWQTLFAEGGGFNYYDYEAGTQVMIDSSNELFAAIESGAIPMSIVGDRAAELFENIEDPAERARLGVALFGTAWEDLGEEALLASMDIQDENEAMLTAEGTMDNMRATMQQGLTPQWERFKRAMQDHLKDALTPLVTAFVDRAIPALEDFSTFIANDAIPALQDMADYMVDFTETVIDAVSESELLNTTIEIVQDVANTFRELASEALDGLGGIEGITNAATDGFSFLQDTLDDLVAFFNQSVIPAFQDAVAYTEDFTKSIISAVKESNLLRNAITFAENLAKKVYGLGVAAIEATGGIEGITNAATDGFYFVIDLVDDLVNSMQDMLSTIQQGLTPQWERFRNITSGFLNNTLIPLVSAFAEGAIPAIRDFASYIGRNAVPALQNLGRFVLGTALPALANFVTVDVVSALQDMASFINDDVLPALQDAADYVADFTEEIIDAVTESGTLNNVISIVSEVADGLYDLSAAAIEALGGVDAIVATGVDGFNLMLNAMLGLAAVFGNLSTESVVVLGGALAIMAAPAVIAGLASVAAGIMGIAGSLGAAMVTAAPLLIAMGLIVAYETDFGGLKTSVDEARDAFKHGDWQTGLGAVAQALLAIPMGIVQELTGLSRADIDERLAGWGVAADAFKIIIGLVRDEIVDATTKVTDFLSTQWEGTTAAWGTAVDVVRTAFELLKPKIDDAKAVIDTLVSTDYGALLGAALGTIQSTIQANLIDPFNAARDVVEAVIAGPTESIKAHVMSIGTTLATWIGDLAGPLLTLTGPFATAVSTIWSKLFGPEFSLKSYVDSLVNGLGGWLSGIAAAVSGPFNSFRDAIQGPIDKIGELIGKIGDLANVELFGVSINDARNLLGFAEGGPIAGGTLAVVGERGPELFYAPSNGVIIPNDVSRQLVSGGGPALPSGRGFGGANEAVNLTVYLDGQVIYDRMQTIKGNRAP